MSKRLLLAKTIRNTGLLQALEKYRSKPGLLVINLHRIGNRSESRFDRGLFSATADQFDRQIKYYKRHLHVVSGDELEALVLGSARLDRMCVALTFDDGYRDNYTAAFQVLQANQVGATFFLVPEYVGSCCIPWWDEIAYLVRNTKEKQLTLDLAEPLILNLGPDREPAILSVLRRYKLVDSKRGEELLDELRQKSDCSLPDVGRRFLSWTEAREMKRAGMLIGSHTQTHRILAHIDPDQQRWELEQSKKMIEEGIGEPISTFAYPVGTRGTFDAITENLVQQVGYSMCFSFYGGINVSGKIEPANILRTGTNPNFLLFCTETMMMAKFGRAIY